MRHLKILSIKAMTDLRQFFEFVRKFQTDSKISPRKQKYIRRIRFMNLCKEIRSKLRDLVLKSGSNEDRKRYTKQRNLRVSLLRKTQKEL